MIMLPDSLSRTGHSILIIALIFIILIAVKVTSYIVTLFSDVAHSHISPGPRNVTAERKGITEFSCNDSYLRTRRTGYSFGRGYDSTFLPGPDF